MTLSGNEPPHALPSGGRHRSRGPSRVKFPPLLTDLIIYPANPDLPNTIEEVDTALQALALADETFDHEAERMRDPEAEALAKEDAEAVAKAEADCAKATGTVPPKDHVED